MPSLFVLDVAEFHPLIAAARARAEVTIEGPKAGYFRLSASGELHMKRAETGLTEAIWFGVFTGGFEGGSIDLDERGFRIGDRNTR